MSEMSLSRQQTALVQTNQSAASYKTRKASWHWGVGGTKDCRGNLASHDLDLVELLHLGRHDAMAFMVICACQVWYVGQFLRYLTGTDLVTHFGLLWPWPWPPDPQCRLFHALAPWTTCTNLQSSSRMRFMSHNWSATKQRLHLQSVAEISCQSVLSGDRIRQCETSSRSHHKDTDQCL